MARTDSGGGGRPAGRGTVDPNAYLSNFNIGGGGTAQQRQGGGRRRFYGVEDDYVIPRQPGDNFGPLAPELGGYDFVTPRYETANADDRRVLLGLPPETLADLQDALREVGLIGKTGYRKGVVDEPTRKGFEELLGFANQTGATWQEALAQYAAAPQVSDQPQAEVFQQPADPGFINKLTPRLTLEAWVQQAAERRLKRRLRGKELQRFIDVYQDMETSANRASFDAELAAALTPQEDGSELEGTDSTIFDVPSAEVAADQFIDNRFGQEAAGQSTYDYFLALQQLIGGR